MATFTDEDGIRAALAAVRANADPTNWMAITTDGKTFFLAGKGEGGVDEMKGLCKEDNIVFSVFRLTDKIDETVAIKFVLLSWLGEGVGRMIKAKLSTQRGSIEALLQPYHTDHSTSDIAEVTTAFFMQKVMNASGTAVHVLADDAPQTHHHNAAAPQASPAPSHSAPAPGAATPPANRAANNNFKSPTVPKSAGNNKSVLKLVDEAGIREAIHNVRNDANPADWVLVGHAKNNEVSLLGQGTGDISGGFVDLLTETNVCYGLVRKSEKFDESITIKFCYVKWQGERVAVMHKAGLSTIKGEMDALFHPWHVDIEATNKDEISDEIIVDKIGKTSGTKTAVKD